MIIKRKYKNDLTKTNILPKRNILSWRTENKDGFLQINELGWGFIWCLIKRKLKTKIYLLITPMRESGEVNIDFFSLKK
jgi:hypothetical protein